MINQYNGEDTEVVIPDTVPEGYIDSDIVGKKVTSITSGAFKNENKVTRVTAGDNLEIIGEHSFEGCTGLKTVTVGSSLRSINTDAFKDCTVLESLTSTSMRDIEWFCDENPNDPDHPQYSFDKGTGVTFYGPHGSDLLDISKAYSSSSFVPTDRHKEPTWTWAPDYSSATAVFDCRDTENNATCEKDGGNGSTFIDNVIDQTEIRTGIEYTASVVVDGETYTDTVMHSYWKELQAEINEGSSIIKLEHDVVASLDDKPLEILEGKEITIDFQKHTIDRRLGETANNGNVFTNNGTLTLTGGGTVMGGHNFGNGGAIVNNGTLNLNGVNIRHNMSMEDGGAIYNSGSGTLNMSSGEISYNYSMKSGGAIYADNGTIEISGGAIKNNSAEREDGGAIYIGTKGDNAATLNLFGGKITDNWANNQGGGIYDAGSLNVKGKPVVKNNTGGNGNNIYLPSEKLISETESLSGEGNLGVTRQENAPGVITSGLYNQGSPSSFFSDNPDYCITDNGSGEATLKQCLEAFDAQVFGHTLTLEGNIGMNTYLRLGNAITSNPDGYQVEFWNGDDLAFSEGVSENKKTTKKKGDVEYTVYRFTVTTVAKEMGTKFKMKIKGPKGYIPFANSDSTPVDADKELDYSINDYLDDRIKNDTDPKMVQLAKDMKAYGIYAEHYFAVRDQGSTKPLPEAPDGFKTVAADELEAYEYTPPKDIGNFTYKGTTLVLESETSFRMYFESDNADALTITATAVGSQKTLELKPKEGKGMYYVAVTDIVAKELDEMYDFTIRNGTEIVTAHHGPLGYAYWALSEQEGENLQYLMMALYRYNQSAKAYFTQQ